MKINNEARQAFQIAFKASRRPNDQQLNQGKQCLLGERTQEVSSTSAFLFSIFFCVLIPIRSVF